MQEAKELLQRGVPTLGDAAVPGDENRPLRRDVPAKSIDLTTEAFRIASQHLSESEILNCVTTWIKEEKSSFLVRALENLATSLGEVIEAIERYQHIAIEESELSLSTQKGPASIAHSAIFFRESRVHQHRQELHRGQRLLRSAGKDHLPPGLSRQARRQKRRAVPGQEDHRKSSGGQCAASAR